MSGIQLSVSSGVKSKSSVPGTNSDRTVFSIAKKTSQSIVDLVMQIMDEGPMPMKNLKPAQKKRTGAEQFHMEHQGLYDALVPHSHDQIGLVHTHNSAYPKMYDELNKRRSTAQVSLRATSCTANEDLSKIHCPDCDKLTKQAELLGRKKKRTNKRSKCKTCRSSRSFQNNKLRKTKTKITKPKGKEQPKSRTAKKFKLSNVMTNKGCQCITYYASNTKKSVATTFNDIYVAGMSTAQTAPIGFLSMTPSNTGNNKYDIRSIMSPTSAETKVSRTCSKKESKSDIDSQNPDTNSAQSVSSYKSFMSMEHEPMIE